MLNLSRRSFLSVGGLGLLSMPQVICAQEQSGTSHKAVINIFWRWPPHQDMWDIKTERLRKFVGHSSRFDQCGGSAHR